MKRPHLQPSIILTGAVCAGFASITYGVALLSRPGAWITGGLLFIALAVLHLVEV